MAEAITSPSFFCCEVCQIQTNSEEQLRAHLLGQKHWQNARQRDLSKRSVYVRGFHPKTTTVSDLTELFQQFGSVHKVILNEKGLYAFIEFSSVESCLQALHHPTRLTMNGKKLVVKPREMKVKRPSTKSESDSKEEEMGSLDSSGLESIEDDEYSKVELKIERELMERITSLQTLDEQIVLLASTQQSPPSLALDYIKVLQYLQSGFSEVFPSCRLVPFGSFVTGQATLTSDLDIGLFTKWTERDEANFADIVSLYSSPVVSQLQPESPTTAMDTSTAAQTSSITDPLLATPKPLPTTTSLPSHVKVGGSADMSGWSKEYLSAINVIGGLFECSNILALPSARCPIVRFTMSSLNVSCDVSVDQRLGPYNSKLLKTYFNFDKRVSPLLYLLKSWLRTCGVMGFKRTQINNYSLSLMLIYALQKTSPPVLPCLQDPRGWPLNMEWYGGTGFMLRKQEALYIDGWNADFVNPNSLLPSKNTSSIAELARNFFHFYSAVFSFYNHTVTVHTPLLLTIQDAVQLSLQNSTQQDSTKEGGGMKISPLCVQDPFDLLHNVTKAVTPSTLNALVEEMKQAALVMDNLLSASPSLHSLGILSLFVCQTPTSTSSPSGKSFNTTYQLHFSLQMIEKLVSKVPAALGLSQCLSTIDIKSPYTRDKLSRAVIRCLVYLLENELEFLCILNNECLSSQKTDTASMTHVSLNTSIFTDTTSDVQESSEDSIDTMDAGEFPSCVEAVSVQKRPRMDDIDSVKKYRIDEEPSPSQILDQFCLTSQGLPFPTNITCTTYTNNWRGRRWKRRHEATVTTSSSPVLLLMLSSMDPSSYRGKKRGKIVVSVALTVNDVSMSSEFSIFFGFFKKLCLS